MIQDSSIINCRVIVIGDPRVGKTCLMNRLVFDTFDENQATTVGASHELIMKGIENKTLQIQIWDTAGEERFKSLGPIYFRKSAGCIAVYDETLPDSFTNLEGWIQSFTDVAGKNTVIAIAANKSDLADDKSIDFQEAKKWAENNNYLIEETSAKEGTGIINLFQELCHRLLERQKTIKDEDVPRYLNNKEQNKSNACGC